MSAASPSLPSLIHGFFARHLVIEQRASPHTIGAYRDALKLFLGFAAAACGRSPDDLDLTVLEPTLIQAFLRWLETDRGCGARTRNHRLAVLQSFARYAASVEPQLLDRCRGIRQLPRARIDHPEPAYLDDDEVGQLLLAVAGPEQRRDRALLLLLYNSGARVQELVSLNVSDFIDGPVPVVRLLGKGRKQRTCPLWTRTRTALLQWLQSRGTPRPEQPLFLNQRGQRITRSGVTYVLRRAAQHGGLTPRHARQLTPHVLRHTTAMHLLQAGVDITTIAAWLGHAQLNTTHGYVAINLRMKQAALAAASVPPEMQEGVYPDDQLIGWLEALGRSARYAQ